MNVPVLLRPAILLIAITTVSCSAATTTSTVAPATQSAMASTSSAPTVLHDDSGPLEPGRYLMTTADGWTTVPFSFTVPLGWSLNEGIISAEADVRHQQLGFTAWDVSHVFGDACAWEGNIVDVGTTADEMADALAAQEGRDPPVDTDITLDGYPGRRVQLGSSATFDESACDQGFLRVWPDPGADLSGGFPSDPGQTEQVSMLDVSGTRAVIIAFYGDAVADEELDELQSVIDSITFEPAT